MLVNYIVKKHILFKKFNEFSSGKNITVNYITKTDRLLI